MYYEVNELSCTQNLNLRKQIKWAKIDSKTVLYNPKVCISFICSHHPTNLQIILYNVQYIIRGKNNRSTPKLNNLLENDFCN